MGDDTKIAKQNYRRLKIFILRITGPFSVIVCTKHQPSEALFQGDMIQRHHEFSRPTDQISSKLGLPLPYASYCDMHLSLFKLKTVFHILYFKNMNFLPQNQWASSNQTWKKVLPSNGNSSCFFFSNERQRHIQI